SSVLTGLLKCNPVFFIYLKLTSIHINNILNLTKIKKEVLKMFELYDKQLEIANECEKKMFDDKDLSRGKVYLSGEMGSGKTYMGSYLANKLSKSYPVLVVSPQININKWADLLDNPTRLKRS